MKTRPKTFHDTMRIFLAFFLFYGSLAAQPQSVLVNGTTDYDGAVLTTISQDPPQHFNNWAGMEVSADKAPLLKFGNLWPLTQPHQDAQLVSIHVEMQAPLGVHTAQYLALPILVSWDADDNFGWLDFQGDPDFDAETYGGLVAEGSIDGVGDVVTWSGTRWRWEATAGLLANGWLIRAFNPPLYQTFSLPELVMEWGRQGDADGDYEIDINDVEAIYSPGTYLAYVDWDNDGDNDKDDMVLACQAAGITPGDANLDGTVDAQDLNVVGLNWGKTRDQWNQGDFTRDGKVNASDLNVLAINWGDPQQSMSQAMDESPHF